MADKIKLAKDMASVAGGVAKTFAGGTAGSGSEKDIDYGPGPSPEPKHLFPPEDFYKGYGAYAPRGAKKSTGKKTSK